MTDDNVKILGNLIGGPRDMGLPIVEPVKPETPPDLTAPKIKKAQPVKPPPIVKVNKKTTINLMNSLREKRESLNKTTPLSLTNRDRLFHLN